jgi:hypothetical protein
MYSYDKPFAPFVAETHFYTYYIHTFRDYVYKSQTDTSGRVVKTAGPAGFQKEKKLQNFMEMLH